MAILRRPLNLIRSPLVCLILAAGVCDVGAQAKAPVREMEKVQTKTPEKEAGRERADELITCEFTVFAPRAVVGLGYFHGGDGDALRAVKFYNSYRSPVYAYRGGAELRFYDVATVEAARERAMAARGTGRAAAKVELRPVATCVIPKGVTKAFLLFVPRAAGAASNGEGVAYDILVLDDGEAAAPAGHVVILNTTRGEFFARINGADTLVRPGLNAPVKVATGRVSFMVVRTEPEYHKLMISDVWEQGPLQRSLLVFFPPRSATALLPDVVRLNEGPVAGGRKR